MNKVKINRDGCRDICLSNEVAHLVQKECLKIEQKAMSRVCTNPKMHNKNFYTSIKKGKNCVVGRVYAGNKYSLNYTLKYPNVLTN